MKTKLTKSFMILAYCIPYVYLAMRGDAIYGTMLFYGFMIVTFGILFTIALKTDNITILIIGNLLSFIISYLFTLKNLPSEEWNWYFKPFSPLSLLRLITILALIVQLSTIAYFKIKEKN